MKPIQLLVLMVVPWLLLAAAGCSSGANGEVDAGDAGSDAGDAGDQGIDAGDQGDGGDSSAGDPGPSSGCAFPLTPLQMHTFQGPYGESQLWDRHILCEIDFDGLDAKVLVKAEPTGVNQFQDPEYEATQAYLCQNDQVTQLDQGTFYYQTFHHGWEEMGVGVDNLKYIFDYADWCTGGRPCNPIFEIFDVRRISDDGLVAENQPAVCAQTTQQGVPKPLVPRVRVPATGVDIVFDMGSLTGDDDESPLHAVTVRPVRIDIREATNRDFALFLNDHGNDCDGHPCLDAGAEGVRLIFEGGAWKPEEGYQDHPVVQVSWYGADAYCNWRSWLVLPTEAQWEMVASAAGNRSYPWGNSAPTCDLALFDDCGAPEPETVCNREAGSSQEGVCDLAGNLAEWVSDWYQADYYTSCTVDCRYPRGPTDDTGVRGIRGGGFSDPAANLRATDRDFADPSSASNRIGVRCMGGAGQPR
ncbi:MAG: SUMF1/EgtB/PvdO family nonheme iron enzyme [Deltaproteobacteria bacterium]|nr:SUMF1/EgtB/PvdO family nonheme iron enzyme [Deltaproteobacteria bacterium]